MRYPLRTRAPQKVFFLCQSIGVRLRARWVGRTRSLGLCTIGMQFEKQALPGPPVQERTCRKKPPVKRHCWDSNPACLQDGALTSYATAPCWIQLLWQQLRGGLQPNRQRHWRSSAPLALLCTPVCIPFSDRKTTKPKVMRAHLPKAPWDSNPDLLFTRQAL